MLQPGRGVCCVARPPDLDPRQPFRSVQLAIAHIKDLRGDALGRVAGRQSVADDAMAILLEVAHREQTGLDRRQQIKLGLGLAAPGIDVMSQSQAQRCGHRTVVADGFTLEPRRPIAFGKRWIEADARPRRRILCPIEPERPIRREGDDQVAAVEQQARGRMGMEGDAQIVEGGLPRQAAIQRQPLAPQIARRDQADQPVGKVVVRQKMPQLALGDRLGHF